MIPGQTGIVAHGLYSQLLSAHVVKKGFSVSSIAISKSKVGSGDNGWRCKMQTDPQLGATGRICNWPVEVGELSQTEFLTGSETGALTHQSAYRSLYCKGGAIEPQRTSLVPVPVTPLPPSVDTQTPEEDNVTVSSAAIVT